MVNSSLGVRVLQELITPFTGDLQCFAALIEQGRSGDAVHLNFMHYVL